MLDLSGCRVGRRDGAGLRALAAAPLPNLASLTLNAACLSAANLPGVLSTSPWLTALTSLSLACNLGDAPGHRALSLLHLPRLRNFSSIVNGLEGPGPGCARQRAVAAAADQAHPPADGLLVTAEL